MNLRECVQGNVTFQYYQNKILFYKCENGFQFPVHIEDTNTAAFLPFDKGIFFMRWIRKEFLIRKELMYLDTLHEKGI
jgi:hypothetical protein